MFRVYARLLRSIFRTVPLPAARPDPAQAADWLPPVIGADDWRSVIMSDCSIGWYLDRR